VVTYTTYCDFYTCSPRTSPTDTVVAVCQERLDTSGLIRERYKRTRSKERII